MTAPVTRKGIVWRIVMATVHIMSALFWPTRVGGRDFVPKAGCALIVANHQSFLDIPLLASAAHHRHLAFVARNTLARSWWLAFIMRHTGTILIDREKGDRAALRAMTEVLRAGGVVVIFPEGQRSRDGELGSPKKGALLAARQAGAPIIPCAVDGTYLAWPPGQRFPRPGVVRVQFGEAVPADHPDALQTTWDGVGRFLADPARPD